MEVRLEEEQAKVAAMEAEKRRPTQQLQTLRCRLIRSAWKSRRNVFRTGSARLLT